MELKERKFRIEICLWILTGLMFFSIMIIPFFADAIVDTVMKIGILFPIMFTILFYQMIRYTIERNKFHKVIIHTD